MVKDIHPSRYIQRGLKSKDTRGVSKCDAETSQFSPLEKLEKSRGFFPGDVDMPQFSMLEGEAAIRYLNLQLDIEQATRARDRRVTNEYKTMPLHEALKLCDQYEEQFRATVAVETRRKNPEATEADINRRQYDILAAHEDTSYIPPAFNR